MQVALKRNVESWYTYLNMASMEEIKSTINIYYTSIWSWPLYMKTCYTDQAIGPSIFYATLLQVFGME